MNTGHEQTEPIQPSLNKVRDGVRRLNNAGISLLDLEGNNLLNECIDLLLDSNLQRFNSFIEQRGYDSTITGYVLADARVQGWEKGAVLYVESLIKGTEWVAKKKGIPYENLTGTLRSKAVGFLYRPPHERVLPTLVKTFMLYPDWHDQIAEGTKMVDWMLNVDACGLQKVLLNLLESKPPYRYTEDDTKNLWKKKGWTEYTSDADRLGKCQPADPDGITTVALAEYNTPHAIEYMASDLLSVRGIEFNLKKLVADILKVLPYREELQLSEYFHKDTFEEDRHSMLRKIFQGVPLL